MRRLPLPAALGPAGGRLSDHPGADLLSRRQPGGDDLGRHRAAGAAVRADAGPEPDDLDQLRRRLGDHPAVRPDLSLDVAEQEVQAAINAAGNLLPADLPAPPIYAKVNPADAPILTLAVTSKTLPLTEVEDMVEHAAGAEDLAAARRRPGQHQRRPAAGGAHPGQPAGAGGLRAEHRRPAHHDRQRQRQHAKGNFDGPAQAYDDQRQRPDLRPAEDYRKSGDRLPQRRAGPAVRRRQRGRRRREHQARRLGEHDAGDDRQHAAPAGRQRHRRWSTRIKALLPQLQATLPAAVDVAVLTDRTPTIRASVADVRVRAAAGRRAGGAGDLPVPAQPAGDDDPEPVGAAVAGRHARRDVPARASASTTCR